jgi:Uma2 family endonuclease
MATASTQTPRPHLATFADLVAVPEEQRFHEVLDGELLRKAMPGWGHGICNGNVRGWLNPFQRQPNGTSRPGGWWFGIEVTVELAPHQVVQPDLSGWRRGRLSEPPNDYAVQLRPDWVCEVMSDGDARRRDGVQKRRIYADAGVPHYWLLDTERERLIVLRLGKLGYVEVMDTGRGERVRAEPFDALELQVGVLFGEDGD